MQTKYRRDVRVNTVAKGIVDGFDFDNHMVTYAFSNTATLIVLVTASYLHPSGAFFSVMTISCLDALVP